jgi:hypothetical protein
MSFFNSFPTQLSNSVYPIIPLFLLFKRVLIFSCSSLVIIDGLFALAGSNVCYTFALICVCAGGNMVIS